MTDVITNPAVLAALKGQQPPPVDTSYPPPIPENKPAGRITNPAVLSALPADSQEQGIGASLDRIAGAAWDAQKGLWSVPLGASEDVMKSVTTVDAQNPLLRGWQRDAAAINRTVIGGSAYAGDIALRALWAPFASAIAAFGQTVEELTGRTPGTAERVTRDVNGMVEMAAIAVGMEPGAAAIPAAKQQIKQFFKKNPKVLDSAVSHLPESEQPAAKTQIKNAVIDAAAETEKKVGNATAAKPIAALDKTVEPPITEPRIVQPLTKDVISAGEELLTNGGVRRDPSMLLSDQIMQLLSSNRLTTPEIASVLDKHNITFTDLASIWRVNIKKAAQDMQALSAAEQRIKALMSQPGAEADLTAMQEGMGIGTTGKAMAWWRRVDNVRRGLMVTQLATAARNFETQVGRVGIDVLQKAIDNQLRRFFPGQVKTDPVSAYGALLRMAQYSKTKNITETIMSALPKESDALFSRYMSDLSKVNSGGVMGKVEHGVQLLNTVNRFQEYLVRRAVFADALDRRLTAMGLNLDEIVKSNRVGAIPLEAIKGATQDALEMTFAKSFDVNTAPGAFINMVNKVPGATIPVPYPRFLVNSLKFVADFHPLGMLRLMSKAERAKLAAGDTSVLSKAIIGTGMLLTAYQIRNSEYAGERWYEIKTSDGRTVDTRPFNPFAAYLFQADLIKRAIDGTLDKLTFQDIVNGIASGSFRAGAGLYAMDQITGGIQDIINGAGSEKDKMVRIVNDFVGNVGSTFLVPFQMVKDLIAHFDKSQGVVRSGNEGPNVGIDIGAKEPMGVNLGPMERMIPYLQDNLPEVESPTRAGPIERQSPLLRQTTGITIGQAKNSAEHELARLGMRWSDILPSTGEPKADRLLAKEMGPLTEQYVVPVVEERVYQQAGDATKELILRNVYEGLRKIALARALAKAPPEDKQMFAQILIKRRLSNLERKAIKEKTGVEVGQ